MNPARPPARKARVSRLTYKALAKLKPGKSLTDADTPGLRFCCVPSNTGNRHHVYGECDLSPFFHPVGSRVRWSFEPIRLGGATGRAAEPHGRPSDPSRCFAGSLSLA